MENTHNPSCFYYYAPKQRNLLLSDIHRIQSSHTFKTVLDSLLQMIPQEISNSVLLLASFIYLLHPLLHPFLFTCVCVHACMHDNIIYKKIDVLMYTLLLIL